jgi:hypothetical protein
MRTALPRLVALLALFASTSGGRGLADAPCLADAERLCPGIPAGDGRLWACLLRNQFQLSSPCQQNISEVQRRASEFNADCAPDVYRFCPGTPPGGGRILQCLRPYVGQRQLSTNCEDSVVTALEKLDEFVAGCDTDAANLCPGVQSGGGRLFACLRSRSEQLSSRCKQVVSP